MRLLLGIITNAISLWLTTLILQAGVRVTGYDGGFWSLVVTYLLLAVIWGLVNGILGSLIRFVGFCFYVITLGLISLVVNGFLFWVVAWVSGQIGFGLTVDNFWWAILAALLMSIFTAIIGAILRPKRRDDNRSSDVRQNA